MKTLKHYAITNFTSYIVPAQNRTEMQEVSAEFRTDFGLFIIVEEHHRWREHTDAVKNRTTQVPIYFNPRCSFRVRWIWKAASCVSQRTQFWSTTFCVSRPAQRIAVSDIKTAVHGRVYLKVSIWLKCQWEIILRTVAGSETLVNKS